VSRYDEKNSTNHLAEEEIKKNRCTLRDAI